ncbi:hypothetical protein D9758_009388 [Tetrapyrgos nigripes]|uniref:Peptidase M20 domain-containing protein 2 n=1 Tax=Tetrapyrgos nigripes TaxID=182062 RepID=A0A8H5FW96_9AGAR|nr:hypothetical protein D9758_009388 [Tetrapyrgos nigripes]
MNSTQTQVWRPEDDTRPTAECPEGLPIFRPDILDFIEQKTQGLSGELRKLSMDLHSNPELAFEEKHAHDVLTEFMSTQGFQVESHYLLPTAWLATFRHGERGRTVGINSEMDALPGVGHACGHNLIAIAGVAVACAMKAALERFDISGTVKLLGTPAEEAAVGKIILLQKGAYDNMDICLMCHPAPGPKGSVSLSSSLAIKGFEAEYFGHTAHAALSPWEGVNALDAAVLAYNNVNALRQHLKPDIRVHGIFKGKDWVTNIIPDYAMYHVAVRAPTLARQEAAAERSVFRSGALATGCTSKITSTVHMYDLRQNKVLGEEVANIVRSRYGTVDYEWGIASASTDFGNVSYEIPSLHPGFGGRTFFSFFVMGAHSRCFHLSAIPTIIGGGNHTREFATAAATMAAHEACLDVSKALAVTGVRYLIDVDFHDRVQREFERDKVAREMIN